MTPQEVIETGVALGTFSLAFVTWRMAKATKKMAEASEDQLQLLRRQTEAAEAVKDQGERRLGAETVPVLNVLRSNGEEIAGGCTTDGDWMVTLKNEGPVPATVTEAKLNLARQPIFLTPRPSGAIEPTGLVVLDGEVPDQIIRDMESGTLPAELSVTYSGPGGQRQNMQTTIRAKEGGARWLVIKREKHKSYDAQAIPGGPGVYAAR